MAKNQRKHKFNSFMKLRQSAGLEEERGEGKQWGEEKENRLYVVYQQKYLN